MESTNPKNKSILEKIAPLILIIGVIVFGYFMFSKFKVAPTNEAVGQIVNIETIQVQVDTDFLMSNSFMALKFIPDSAVFNEVTGVIQAGREDPFAPVK